MDNYGIRIVVDFKGPHAELPIVTCAYVHLVAEAAVRLGLGMMLPKAGPYNGSECEVIITGPPCIIAPMFRRLCDTLPEDRWEIKWYTVNFV